MHLKANKYGTPLMLLKHGQYESMRAKEAERGSKKAHTRAVFVLGVEKVSSAIVSRSIGNHALQGSKVTQAEERKAGECFICVPGQQVMHT